MPSRTPFLIWALPTLFGAISREPTALGSSLSPEIELSLMREPSINLAAVAPPAPPTANNPAAATTATAGLETVLHRESPKLTGCGYLGR